MPLRMRRSLSSIMVKSSAKSEIAAEIQKDKAGCARNGFESSSYHFDNAQHATAVLRSFDDLRKQKIFTDVILTTSDGEFPCHRIVLLSGSNYFRAMFCNDHRESRETEVEINGVEANIMEILLDYLYTSRAYINDHNAQPLLEASNLFEIFALRDACARFMEGQLDPCNCIGMRGFAEIHGLVNLFEKASRMCNEKFVEVAKHEEFLELSKSSVIECISDDDINVSGEEIVYEAVKRWVAHDDVSRSEHLAELLSHVRLPLVPPTYFVNTIECDPQIVCNPSCQKILMETRKFHILGNEINSERTRPRRSTGWSAAVVIVGGQHRALGYNTPYVDAFDPVSGKWTPLAKLPTFSKSEYAVASFRNTIIVSGGKVHSRDVWLYQSHIDSWVKVAPLCKGRWRHQMATMGGHIYCVGGYDGKKHLVGVERYDSYSNSWSETSPLIFPVPFCAVASCQGKLYVIGTSDVNIPCKMQAYDPSTEKWAKEPSMPAALPSVSAAALNGKIYVIGGVSTYSYDPLVSTWTLICDDGEDFEQCEMTTCGGKLFVTGGSWKSEGVSDSIYCYEPKAEEIVAVATMPRPSICHGCVTIHRYNTK